MARVVGGNAQQKAAKARRQLRVWAAAAVAAAALLFLYIVMPRLQGTPQSAGSPDSSTGNTMSFGEAEPASHEPVAAAAAASAAADDKAAAEEPAAAAAAGGDGDNEQYRTGVFYTTGGEDGAPLEEHELLNEPVPEDCFMEEHADYAGPALTWGLTYKLPSAAQCCQECKQRSKAQPNGERCHVWVFCGSLTGECWSPDIWNHTTGECWLKYQAGWDGNTDRAATNLEVNDRGAYSAAFRQEHKTAPDMVAWSAGVVPPT